MPIITGARAWWCKGAKTVYYRFNSPTIIKDLDVVTLNTVTRGADRSVIVDSRSVVVDAATGVAADPSALSGARGGGGANDRPGRIRDRRAASDEGSSSYTARYM